MSEYSTATVTNLEVENAFANELSQFDRPHDTVSRAPLYFVDPRAKDSRRTSSDQVPVTGSFLPQPLEAEEAELPFVVVPKLQPTVQSRFIPQQKWEGYVLDVQDECFFARLVDLTSGHVDEEAEFLLEDVPASDRDMVNVGAVFYWGIGYEDKVDGQRMRASSIRFRRLPTWTSEELKDAERKAEEWAQFFESQGSQP